MEEESLPEQTWSDPACENQQVRAGRDKLMLDSKGLRFKHLMLNAIGLAAPLIGALVSVPILLRELSQEEFSLLSLYWVIIGYSGVLELGLGRSVTRKLSALKETTSEEVLQIASTAIIMGALLGLLCSVFLIFGLPILFGEYVVVPVELQKDNLQSILIVSFSAPTIVLSSIFLGVLEAKRRFDWIAIVRIPTGLAMFVAPALLALEGHGLPTLLLGILLIRLILCCVLGWRVQLELPGSVTKFAYDRNCARDMLGFGGWLTVSAIVGPLLVYADRFILSSAHGLSATAQYTPPFEAVIRFLVIASAVTGVMFPRFSSATALNKQKQQSLFVEGNLWVFIGTVPVAIAFWLFGRTLFEIWLGRTPIADLDLDTATSIAAILSIGLVVNACAHIPQALIQAHGHARWTALLHVGELCCYLLYAPPLITEFGVYGAAYAWLIRAAISAIALYYFSSRLLREPASRDYL